MHQLSTTCGRQRNLQEMSKARHARANRAAAAAACRGMQSHVRHHAHAAGPLPAPFEACGGAGAQPPAHRRMCKQQRELTIPTAAVGQCIGRMLPPRTCGQFRPLHVGCNACGRMMLPRRTCDPMRRRELECLWRARAPQWTRRMQACHLSPAAGKPPHYRRSRNTPAKLASLQRASPRNLRPKLAWSGALAPPWRCFRAGCNVLVHAGRACGFTHRVAVPQWTRRGWVQACRLRMQKSGTRRKAASASNRIASCSRCQWSRCSKNAAATAAAMAGGYDWLCFNALRPTTRSRPLLSM